MAARDLFLFGTLRDPALLSLVASCPVSELDLCPAQAADRAVLRALGTANPVLADRPGSVADGLLLADVPQELFDRLVFFEDAFGYGLHDIEVRTGAGVRTAQVFLPDDAATASEEPWSLTAWQDHGRALMLEIADEIMSLYARQTAENTPVNLSAIRVRAESRLRAKSEENQVNVRHSFTEKDVDVARLSRPYSKFFGLEEYELTHRKFGGGWSNPLSRTAFTSADAVTVLPYDPVLDKVVLIEQFRIGAYARGDRHPWLLEVVAGRCDSGQTPEAVARREAEEEAGLTLGRMERVADYYASPGAYNEYIFSFIGQADLSGYRESVHGLGCENEDIATHLLDVDRLLPLVASGEANNTPLIISILWLAINRERLQKEWRGA